MGALALPAVAQGDLWYGAAAGTISALAKNTTATTYLSNTGSSNNPAWSQINLANGVTGTLSNSNLTSLAANTVLGALTATTPAGLTMPSCSVTNALGWTSGTGFACNSSITANAVPAANLTGATLAAGVTASSLTSVGTLSSLTVSGSTTLSGISGSTQCLHVNNSGVISGTGSDCGSGTVTASPQYQLAYYPNSGSVATVSGDSSIKTDANSDLLVISGSIGLGTATPQGMMTVYGASTVASAAGAKLDYLSLPAATTTITGTTGITTAKGFNAVSLYQPTYTDLSTETVTKAATLYIDNAPAQGGLLTITNPLALAVNAGNSYFGGNVGIGSMSPSVELDIEQPRTGNDTLLNLGVTGTGVVGDTVGMTFSSPGTGGTVHVDAGIYGIMGQTNGVGSLALFTARTAGVLSEAMRIDALGNVGIGTASPAQLLDVNGTVQIDGSLKTNNGSDLIYTNCKYSSYLQCFDILPERRHSWNSNRHDSGENLADLPGRDTAVQPTHLRL